MSEQSSQSDDFPRATPYELVFSGADIDFEGERFPALLEEAAARDASIAEPSAFVMLGGAGALVRELMLADAEPDAEGTEWQAPPPEAIAELGALLFHAFRFWRNGRKILELDRAVARYLVESAPVVDDWRMSAPAAAGYLQLPRNLFWTPTAEGEPPEPVDGFFWSVDDRLDVLLCAGVRPGRPGFTALPVGAEFGGADGVAHWAGIDARPGERDFGNVLPGGEIEGLYALTNTAEALKLASLCFWFVDRDPASLRPIEPQHDDEDAPLRSRVELAPGS